MRLATTQWKLAFQDIKKVIEQAESNNVLIIIEFFFKSVLEVVSQINKAYKNTVRVLGISDKLLSLWGVYSREVTLQAVAGMFDLVDNPSQDMKFDVVQLDKCHNMAWKVICKLAKIKLIYKEHIVVFWPRAVNQLSNLFGMTSSERLPTIIGFLTVLIRLRD